MIWALLDPREHGIRPSSAWLVEEPLSGWDPVGGTDNVATPRTVSEDISIPAGVISRGSL